MNPAPSAAIANLAAAEFQRRQRYAADAVRKGEWTADTATQKLRPWLAIACLAGAGLPELAEGLAELRICQTFPGGAPGTRDEAEAHIILADSICGASIWKAELARARDSAVGAAHDETTIARARALRSLSTALGVSDAPIAPPAEKELAA